MPASSRDLALHGLFERLAALDEAGERREERARPRGLAAEQAALAVEHEHDHHRVGAREVLGRARVAPAGPAAVLRARRLAAAGAEAVAGMPVQQVARLRRDRRVAGREEARDRAQLREVRDAVEAELRERLGAVGEIGREVRDAVGDAEEDGLGRGLAAVEQGGRRPRQLRRVAACARAETGARPAARAWRRRRAARAARRRRGAAARRGRACCR